MLFFAITLTCFLALFSQGLVADPAEGKLESTSRVKVEVNLESLCPDSRRFVSRQLLPTFNDVGDIMQVDIIPFGHARTLGNNRMICQHGARECEGNRRMACVISRAKGDQKQIIQTIGCLFKFEPPKQCIEQNLPGVSYEDIEKCKESNESYAMMEENEKRTGRIDYVPRIKIDDKFSEELQEEAENNLKRAVCNSFKGSDKSKKCAEELVPVVQKDF